MITNGVNGINQNIYPVIYPKTGHNIQNNQAQSPQKGQLYPVHLNQPYGINQCSYIKEGVQKLPGGELIHLYRLINGQKIGIIQGKGCPVIQTRIGVGSLDEDENIKGISHLIEHSVYHGSKKYDDPEEAIKKAGGYTNAQTSHNSTQYYIKLDNDDPKNLLDALDVQADMIFNPNFSKLEKERAIVSSEVQKGESNEENVVLSALSKNLFNISTQAKDIILGTRENIANISQDDMFYYHQKYYVPNNTATIISSPLNPDELIASVAQRFLEAAPKASLKMPERKGYTPLKGIKRYDSISKVDPKGEILIGFCGPNSKYTKEDIKIRALLELIALRGRFDGYKFDSNPDFSRIIFQRSLEFEDENECFCQLREAIDDVVSNPVSDYEIQTIKNQLTRELEGSYLSNENKYTNLAEELGQNGTTTAQEKKDLINSLDKNQILDALKYLDTNNCAISVIHPKGTTQEDIRAKYEKSKQYITPVKIPKTSQNIDISGSIQAHNITPYTDKPVYSATLPDNTNLSIANSDSERCMIYWKLNPQNTDKHSAAISYVIQYMTKTPNLEKEYKEDITDSKTHGIYGINGLTLFARCRYSDIVSTIETLKEKFDVDFSKEVFDLAKTIALSDINSLEEKSLDKQNRARWGEIYNMNPQELAKELETITLEDVKRYYNDLLLNSVSYASVVAPVNEHPELIGQIANALYIPGFSFKKDAKQDIYNPNTRSRCFITEEKNGQSKFQKIYNFKTSGNSQDQTKFRLLDKIISKRLFDDLREKQGLAYEVCSSLDEYQNDESIILSVTSSCNGEEDVKKIFDGFSYHTQKLTEENITPDELEAAKSAYRREVLEGFIQEDIAAIQLNMSSRSPMGLAELENSFEILESITPDDIREAANYVFSSVPDYALDLESHVLDKNEEFFKTLGKIA